MTRSDRQPDLPDTSSEPTCLTSLGQLLRWNSRAVLWGESVLLDRMESDGRSEKRDGVLEGARRRRGGRQNPMLKS